MSERRVAGRGLVLLFGVLALAAASCGDEEPSGPPPDFTVRIMESVFIQHFDEVHVGQTVEWENRYRDTRTVTSGLGPDDPDAGALFDEVLAGYPSGKAVGGRFRFKFTEPDTIHYFSRFAPVELPDGFGGTIIVIP